MSNPNTNRARDFATRLNNLMNEEARAKNGIKELKKEAKGEGYDEAALVTAVKQLREDASKKNKRREKEEQLELMLGALDGLVLSVE